MRVSTSALNQVLTDAMLITPPPSDRGKRLRIRYGTQVSVKPPTLVLFVNDPELAHFSYLRYLENRIREGTSVFREPPCASACAKGSR